MKWVLRDEKEINGRPRHHVYFVGRFLTIQSGTKVYGFLTVSEDAKCGVCAHEIGHLGRLHIELLNCANKHSLWMAGSL